MSLSTVQGTRQRSSKGEETDKESVADKLAQWQQLTQARWLGRGDDIVLGVNVRQ